MTKKILSVAITTFVFYLVGMMTISGCKKEEAGNTPETKGVDSLKLSSSVDTILVNRTTTISVTIFPEDAECNISVSSSDSNVATATISDKVVTVKGVKAGESTITVNADTCTATCKVVVQERQEYSVKLNMHSAEIEEGSSIRLLAEVKPEYGFSLYWSSTKESVAKVFGIGTAGLVSGRETGQTTIYCVANGYGELRDSCIVTVVPAAVDLSTNGTSNCYIISEPARCKFKATKGNSTEAISGIKGAKVLWESFGTVTKPDSGAIITGVSYSKDYIIFRTHPTFVEGNAVIAAYSDSACTEGNVLWSWHIWCTDTPAEQDYNNKAGTMMDRNLGATSATPGDVGALGLLYQWGRKDPFLGSSSYTGGTTKASSTGTWDNTPVADNSSVTDTNLKYSIKHPTTFIKGKLMNYDWYCDDAKRQNNDLWKSVKTIYDPCPAGWHVPAGDSTGIWCTAFDTTKAWKTYKNWDETHKGMDFGKTDKKLVGTGSDQCWYPATGSLDKESGGLSQVSAWGYHWSYSACTDKYVYYSIFSNTGSVTPTSKSALRAEGHSVRCIKEVKK